MSTMLFEMSKSFDEFLARRKLWSLDILCYRILVSVEPIRPSIPLAP